MTQLNGRNLGTILPFVARRAEASRGQAANQRPGAYLMQTAYLTCSFDTFWSISSLGATHRWDRWVSHFAPCAPTVAPR